MLWAEHVAKNTAGSRDDVFEEVRRHFNDAELVELTGVCGLFAQSNRFQDSLKLPIEPPHEVDKIRNSIQVDPARVKAYIERLLETWPAQFPAPAGAASIAARAAPAAAAHEKERAPAPRIPQLDPETATGEAAHFLRLAQQLLGGLPSFARLWAHVPHLGKLLLPLPVALTREGLGSSLPRALKAIVLLRTSQVNEAPYSLAHHAAMARAAGLSPDQLSALSAGTVASAPGFTPRERAASAWADHVARNTAKNHDDIFNQLKAYFADAEIVELTALCTVASKMDRIHNALRLPLEPAAEFTALNLSAEIDPVRLRDYLNAVVAGWPRELPVPAN